MWHVLSVGLCEDFSVILMRIDEVSRKSEGVLS